MAGTPFRSLILRPVRAIVTASALACAAWLLVAAFAKLASPATFAHVLRAHQIVPTPLIPYATTAVPVAEAACGITALAFVIHGMPRAALCVIAAAFLHIGAYALALVHRAPLPSPCGCGPADHIVRDWAPIALWNLGLASGLSLLGVVARAGPSRPDPPKKPPSPGARSP